MALTRKMLKDMQLDEQAIEDIIAAHTASIDGLTAQRDELLAALSEAENLRQERDELRLLADQLPAAQAEAAEARQALLDYQAEQTLRQRTEALVAALVDAGCNAAAAPLMAGEIAPGDIVLEDGHVKDADALIAPLREKYPALFAKPIRLATPTVTPPIASGGALTREDLARMSDEEINRNWNAVKGVLSKGVI